MSVDIVDRLRAFPIIGGPCMDAAEEIERLRMVLSYLVEYLAEADEEGLIEHAEPMRLARKVLAGTTPHPEPTEAERPFSQARHDMDEINFKRERERSDRFLSLVQAGSDLCEEIRATGTHESWKQLGHALDTLDQFGEGVRYKCTKGHDRCGEMYAGPECPYCEKVASA